MLGSGTSKVLDECVALLASPNHNRYPASAAPSSKFDTHPDIQYFKSIKEKNHYGYHQRKRQKIHGQADRSTTASPVFFNSSVHADNSSFIDSFDVSLCPPGSSALPGAPIQEAATAPSTTLQTTLQTAQTLKALQTLQTLQTAQTAIHQIAFTAHPSVLALQSVLIPTHSPSSAASDSPVLAATHVNPHDLAALLDRLSTYTVLGWKIPDFQHQPALSNSLNELACSRKGWVCATPESAVGTGCTVIQCTACYHKLHLKFNDIASPSAYIPFEYDEDDYMELNVALGNSFVAQIQLTGHDANCLWRIYETPLDGVYYQRPYIDETNQMLMNDYLKNLKGLMENRDTVLKQLEFLTIDSLPVCPEQYVRKFISCSNTLLFDKYYKQDQENSYIQVEQDDVPSSIYRLAVLGWNLNVQHFALRLVLLLKCSKCNSRVFLPNQEVESSGDILDDTVSGQMLSISPSRTLAPCIYPAQQPTTHSLYEAHDEDFAISCEHKPWCSQLHRGAFNKTPGDLLVELVLLDSAVEISPKPKQYGKSDDAINDNLQRLDNLRKVFLTDE